MKNKRISPSYIISLILSVTISTPLYAANSSFYDNCSPETTAAWFISNGGGCASSTPALELGQGYDSFNYAANDKCLVGTKKYCV